MSTNRCNFFGEESVSYFSIRFLDNCFTIFSSYFRASLLGLYSRHTVCTNNLQRKWTKLKIYKLKKLRRKNNAKGNKLLNITIWRPKDIWMLGILSSLWEIFLWLFCQSSSTNIFPSTPEYVFLSPCRRGAKYIGE